MVLKSFINSKHSAHGSELQEGIKQIPNLVVNYFLAPIFTSPPGPYFIFHKIPHTGLTFYQTPRGPCRDVDIDFHCPFRCLVRTVSCPLRRGLRKTIFRLRAPKACRLLYVHLYGYKARDKHGSKNGMRKIDKQGRCEISEAFALGMGFFFWG